MQQILTERHSGTTFKGKLKLYHFKIVKYKTRAFNRKFEIKPIPILLNISRLPRAITCDIAVRFSRQI